MASKVDSVKPRNPVQGYLAHKKTPSTRTLLLAYASGPTVGPGLGPSKGPRGVGGFSRARYPCTGCNNGLLHSDTASVGLHTRCQAALGLPTVSLFSVSARTPLQGYLAHKKTPSTRTL